MHLQERLEKPSSHRGARGRKPGLSQHPLAQRDCLTSAEKGANRIRRNFSEMYPQVIIKNSDCFTAIKGKEDRGRGGKLKEKATSPQQ